MFKRKTKALKIHRLDELQPLVASGRPVLVNFSQVGCPACQVMDGVVNELAREYGDSAHIVKADIGRVPGAIDAYKIRSTPTTVVIARAPEKTSKKASQNAKGTNKRQANRPTQRWRASGLVKKDQLARVLESNGARRTED
ncbi:MAG TPA: thioredoxin family protein [Acidimicrobiia bacterium]|nr:thioredoxin family protein [Acidimicrobiia bacterium]